MEIVGEHKVYRQTCHGYREVARASGVVGNTWHPSWRRE